jgi:SulP family sulfate permease
MRIIPENGCAASPSLRLRERCQIIGPHSLRLLPVPSPSTVQNPLLERVFPFLRWRHLFTRDTLRADLIAGAVSALIVLPQGVAFATLAGMPPEYGLYCAMAPAVAGALFGSSWHLISGPTNAISLFVFATISPLAEPATADYVNLVLTLTFLTGVFQLAMGVARLGTLVNFISHTVVIGFTAGAALLIFAAQLKNFFGIAIPRSASFVDTLREFAGHVTEFNPYVVAVAVVSLVCGMLFRRYVPRFPYMIAAMIVGSVAALVLNHAFGQDVTGIATVGALPSGLPPLSGPDLSIDTLARVAPMAFAVTILGLTEAISIGRAIAVRSGQRIDGNQEFIGQGLSNLAGAVLSGYASSGSFNRSGVNFDAGARTPLAAVLSAVFLVAILLLVAPLARYLPIPVMAAILFIVAYGLIDFHHIRSILRSGRSESCVLVTTFLATLLLDLDFAIYLGVIVSLMVFLYRTSQPAILDVKPDPAEGSYHHSADTGLPDCPQVKMLRVNGAIFFGAVDHVEGVMRKVDAENPRQKHLLLVATGINFIDVAGAEMLALEARRRREIGGGLYFYRAKDAVRAVLERGGYMNDVGTRNLLPVKTRAIGAIYPHLDSEICRRCTVRIFRECRLRLPNGEPVAHTGPVA